MKNAIHFKIIKVDSHKFNFSFMKMQSFLLLKFVHRFDGLHQEKHEKAYKKAFMY